MALHYPELDGDGGMDVNSPEAALWSENMRLKSENKNLRAALRDVLAIGSMLAQHAGKAVLVDYIKETQTARAALT